MPVRKSVAGRPVGVTFACYAFASDKIYLSDPVVYYHAD